MFFKTLYYNEKRDKIKNCELRLGFAENCLEVALKQKEPYEFNRNLYYALSHLAQVPELCIRLHAWDNLIYNLHPEVNEECVSYVRKKIEELIDYKTNLVLSGG